MKDPIVIEPENFNQQKAWQECHDWQDNHEGFAAAAGADPGVCSCPACDEMYWAWGSKQRCVGCGFEFPTDAWAMFSWGTQARWRKENPPPAYRSDPAMAKRMADYDARRLWHPYFCYGYEHGPKQTEVSEAGAGSLFEYYKRQEWRTIMATYKGHEKYPRKQREMPPEVSKALVAALSARAAIVDFLGGPWKKGNPSASGVIDCPVCEQKGTLHFSRAGYNGHVHAKCETDDCVSWME